MNSFLQYNSNKKLSPSNICAFINSKEKFQSQFMLELTKNKADKTKKPTLIENVQNLLNRLIPKNKNKNKAKKAYSINPNFLSFSHIKRRKKTRNFLVVVYLVKKFIQILKTYTMLQKILKLKEFHFKVINDPSNYYKNSLEFGNYFFLGLNQTQSNFVKTYIILFKIIKIKQLFLFFFRKPTFSINFFIYF